MRKTLLLAGLVALTAPASFGQTTLAAGDLYLVQVSQDTPKTFTFVPLVNLAAGTVVNFTDNAWNGSTNAFRTGEGVVTWTASSAVTAGTQITVNDPTVASPVVSTGTAAMTGAFNPSTSGDQILVYQGTSASPTFISAVNWGLATGWITSGTPTSNNSYNPAGSNGLSLGNFDNFAYTGSGSSDPATFRSSVLNASNWTSSDTAVVPPTGGSLPVELASFTSSVNGRSARLNWTTASETNNAGFYVEQQNGNAWIAVSNLINGHGTTTERNAYAFDVTGLTAGSHTFRLRQVDTDGAVHYSATTTVEIAAQDGLALTALGARGLRVESEAAATVSVFDLMGRRVLQREVGAGTSVVTLEGVGAGVYVVRAESAGKVATTRFVVR